MSEIHFEFTVLEGNCKRGKQCRTFSSGRQRGCATGGESKLVTEKILALWKPERKLGAKNKEVAKSGAASCSLPLSTDSTHTRQGSDDIPYI